VEGSDDSYSGGQADCDQTAQVYASGLARCNRGMASTWDTHEAGGNASAGRNGLGFTSSPKCVGNDMIVVDLIGIHYLDDMTFAGP
jgi:hypothetical protein